MRWVGMAGLLSAATHSPITAMILLFEVSGDYAIILPVMIVATLAALVGRVLETDSLYTRQLTRKGIALHRREDIIMRTHTVGEVMSPAAHVVRESVTARVSSFPSSIPPAAWSASSREETCFTSTGASCYGTNFSA
jgi:hypothetical protein